MPGGRWQKKRDGAGKKDRRDQRNERWGRRERHDYRDHERESLCIKGHRHGCIGEATKGGVTVGNL